MSAKDVFHESVKHALQKEKWVITHDPLILEFSEENRLKVDLAAERLLAAERDRQAVAEYQLKMLVYDPINEVIVQWIN